MNLTKDDIYVGIGSVNGPTFVLGHEFGPKMLAVGCDIEDALSEWDERHGERVFPDDGNPDDVDAAIWDYPGRTLGDKIEAAVDHGDIRSNDGGTMVWVNHYEWIREFRNPREAGAFFRGII